MVNTDHLIYVDVVYKFTGNHTTENHNVIQLINLQDNHYDTRRSTENIVRWMKRNRDRIRHEYVVRNFMKMILRKMFQIVLDTRNINDSGSEL